MNTFLELPVSVSFVGNREWRARCAGVRKTCDYSGEEAARRAVAAALDASGKLSVPVNPRKVKLVKNADGSLVGRLDLESGIGA